MPDQQPSQEINVTVQENAHIEGAAIGDKNRVMNQVTAGGDVIQAENLTIVQESAETAKRQAEDAAAIFMAVSA